MTLSTEQNGDSIATMVDTEASSTQGVRDDCPHCFGTGMEVIPGEGARRCRCQTPDQRDRLLKRARIPPRYQHCTIQGYEAANDELSKWAAKMEAQIVIDDYLTIDGRGLLFNGPVGVGKTHLAVAILRELIARYQV